MQAMIWIPVSLIALADAAFFIVRNGAGWAVLLGIVASCMLLTFGLQYLWRYRRLRSDEQDGTSEN